jgi:hypothetical protein
MNEWEARHGKRRRKIDRDLLAEVEAQIAREERSIIADKTSRIYPGDEKPHARFVDETAPRGDTEREHIALAFGRPLR